MIDLTAVAWSQDPAAAIAEIDGLRKVLVELVAPRPEWHRRAACRHAGPEVFFLDRGQSPAAAYALCDACPVRSECLAAAIDDPYTDGIWGRTSPRVRRRLRLGSTPEQQRSPE